MRSSDRQAAETSEAARASGHDSIVIHSGPLSMFGAKAEMASYLGANGIEASV
jgi:precorrin-4 methylase